MNLNHIRKEQSKERERIKIFSEILHTLGEPEICKHFGCGKMLTLQEKRFGNYCVEHGFIVNQPLVKNGLFSGDSKPCFKNHTRKAACNYLQMLPARISQN